MLNPKHVEVILCLIDSFSIHSLSNQFESYGKNILCI